MDAVAGSARRAAALPWRADPGRVAAWALGFVLPLYLALENGGFDIVLRSQVGIAVCWILLLGAAIGVLGVGLTREAWLSVGLLAAFAAWTALSMTWSESVERSSIEMGRVAMYVGVFALALCVRARAPGRAVLNGVASAIGVVAALAVLSRIHPAWFPADELARQFPDNAKRLNYPLNYWNALAAFVVLGLPLLGAIAATGRTLAGRAAAAAALPVVALCIYYTVSRGGVIAAAIALLVFLVLAADRISIGAMLVAPVAGTLILIASAADRAELRDGLRTSQALSQGDDMLALGLITVVGVGLVSVAVALLLSLPRPSWLRPSRTVTAALAAAALAVVVVGGVAAGVPNRVSDAWTTFKNPEAEERLGANEDVFSRLQNAAGNGRYQYWSSALDAERSEPLLGIGAGTFEFWWARNSTFDSGYIRDAHSLWFETLGELGIIGFLLLAGVFAIALGAGVVRALRGPPAGRTLYAAAVASLAALTFAFLIDWGWEIGALPIVGFLLMAVVLVGDPRADTPARAAIPARIALGVVAVLAIAAMAWPMATERAVRDSQTAAERGDLAAALKDARTGTATNGQAATPLLQEALVLEEAGHLRAAHGIVIRATTLEPTNWRNWYVRARIAARLGRANEAVASYRRARSLNVRSPLFAKEG